ncbi:hypothetical protein BKH43_06390 [Helicobacter sp. 13S00401-1]|uniref:septum site-determining protein MinC n=1 Tax=Helicobacter sp. 13S00401-1 TaxID=1905758 RepID=UPI000BA60028|nr:septum site-determining protein MinC [Helicobacter sp. 13S00401-1]PAF49714.1 hypothetical protein BKH43_06390 [Helicobacter sp. 13S00401-1]
MVKARQKTIRVFEFEEGTLDEIKAYTLKHAELLRNYYFSFKDELLATINDEGLKKLLSSMNMQYLEFKDIKEEESDDGLSLFDDECYKDDLDIDPAFDETKILDSLKKAALLKEESDDVESISDSTITRNADTLVINRHVRSGEEIFSAGDCVIHGNVHSGASVTCMGSLSILGKKCEGNINCDGDVLILRNIFIGRVTFQGNILNKEDVEAINLNSNLKMLRLNQRLEITELNPL